MGLSRERLSEEEKFIEGLRCRSPGTDLVHPVRENDNINHPPHYNNSPAKCDCGRKIECIDVTRHLNFNLGNAIKYLWRCDLKGASIDDLRKSIWYIQDEIKQRLKS